MILPFENFTLVPIEELMTPNDNYRVVINRWWVCYQGKALIYTKNGNYSLQCNVKEEIADAIIDKLYPECEAKFIAMAFVKRV